MHASRQTVVRHVGNWPIERLRKRPTLAWSTHEQSTHKSTETQERYHWLPWAYLGRVHTTRAKQYTSQDQYFPVSSAAHSQCTYSWRVKILWLLAGSNCSEAALIFTTIHEAMKIRKKKKHHVTLLLIVSSLNSMVRNFSSILQIMLVASFVTDNNY